MRASTTSPKVQSWFRRRTRYTTSYARPRLRRSSRASLLSGYILSTVASFPRVANPESTLVIDSSGDLLGTTYECGDSNAGSVFEIANWNTAITTLLHHLTTCPDGQNPVAGVTLDSSGDLFGTAVEGGTPMVAAAPVWEIAKGTTTITAVASFKRQRRILPHGWCYSRLQRRPPGNN